MEGINTDTIDALKQKAKQFTEDNFSFPTRVEYLLIENAFLSGAATFAAEEARQEKERTDAASR